MIYTSQRFFEAILCFKIHKSFYAHIYLSRQKCAYFFIIIFYIEFLTKRKMFSKKAFLTNKNKCE